MRKRADRRWTLMLVPHGSGSSRAVEVSQAVVKTLLGLGGAIGILVVVLGIAAVVRGVNITRNRALEGENQVLAGEIQRMRGRLANLTDTITAIDQREQQLRRLANLEPLDSGVQQGGIGGPAGTGPERDSLAPLGPHGQEALAARLDVDLLIRRADVLAQSMSTAYDSLSSHQKRFAATPSIMPTKGWLSSAFAAERVHPLLHIARPHEGIDVSAPLGTAIEAPAAGVVIDARWEDGYGNLLAIDHGYGLMTRYAHCSKILVVRGQRVKRGDKIALVGATGLATGPHLHYEVWVNGKPVDPMKFVLPDALVD
jgi:murein DD-endopeptidase MepM/ murein hydrolase activator NlpD